MRFYFLLSPCFYTVTLDIDQLMLTYCNMVYLKFYLSYLSVEKTATHKAAYKKVTPLSFPKSRNSSFRPL